MLVLLAALAAVTAVGAQSPSAPPLSVRITSPMGRTGTTTAVRIVAQVQYAPSAAPGQVRFFVDRQLLGAVHQPPYAVEWVDENPFERREISVEVVDALGHAGPTDTVVLEPFEVTESADVASVLLEASVQDKKGRFVKDLTAGAFTLFEDDVRQSLDLVTNEAVGATFALLVDSSGSMSRRMDFVQRTAGTLARYLSPRDRMLIAPFAKELGAITGPTTDRATILEAVQAIQSHGGTAILDSSREDAADPGVSRGTAGRHSDHGRVRRAQFDVVCRRAGRRQSLGGHGVCGGHRRRRGDFDQGRAAPPAARASRPVGGSSSRPGMSNSRTCTTC